MYNVRSSLNFKHKVTPESLIGCWEIEREYHMTRVWLEIYWTRNIKKAITPD